MTRRHSGSVPGDDNSPATTSTTTTTSDASSNIDPSSSLHLLSMLSQTPHSRAVENDYIENPCRSTSEPPRDKPAPVVLVQEEVLLGSSTSNDNFLLVDDIVTFGDHAAPHSSSRRLHRSQHRNHHRHHHNKITKADLTSERHRRPMPLPGAAARVSSFSLPNNFTTRSSDRHVSGSSIFTTSTNMYLPGGNGAPVIPPRPFSSSTSAVNASTPFRQRTMTDDHLHSRPPPPLPSDSRGSIPPRPSSTPPPRPPKSAEVVARLGMAPLRDSHSETIMVRHHSDWLRIAQPLGVPVGMVPPMRTDVFRLPIRSTPPVTSNTDSPTHQIVRTSQPLRRLGDNPVSNSNSSKSKKSSSKTSDSSTTRKSSKNSSSNKSSKKSSSRSRHESSTTRTYNSKLTASDSTQPLMKHGLRVDVTVPELESELETDKLLCKKDGSGQDKVPHHCPHCGKCVCPKCVEATAPTSTPAEEKAVVDCHCNTSAACVDACVETVTCLRCVRGCFYHCESDGSAGAAEDHQQDSTWADKPCACRGASCCLRWSVLGFMSCLLPCLLCYPVLRGCTVACRSARKSNCIKSSGGCHCHDDDS